MDPTSDDIFTPDDPPSVDPLDGGSGDEVPELFAPGELVDGRYRVVRTIAHGGMGVVFEVLDCALDISLALKAVKPHIARQAQTLDRFRREIRLASRVTHPNVCRLYGAGLHTSDDGFEVHYLTMELLEGETLSAWLRREGPMALAEAEPIIRQILAGLAAAHEADIVHRDLKPSNVILVPAAEGGARAVITDFGLSRCLIPESETSRLTATGQLMGTPAYFAPELLEGQRLIAASDVYALGVVVFEMLSGELPFVGRTPFVMALRRLSEPPRSIRELVPTLDRRWVHWLGCCLQRKPEDRPADGAALRELLDRGDRLAPAIGRVEPLAMAPAVARREDDAAPPTAGRPWLGGVAIALILVSLLALLAVFFAWRASRGGGDMAPLRLVITPSEVEGMVAGEDPAVSRDLAFGLELALRRGASTLDQLHLIERAVSEVVAGDAGEVGRACAADEVVTSHVEVVNDEWRVVLQRIEVASRRVAWRRELAIPAAQPRLLAHAVDEALTLGFSDHRRRRSGQGALGLESTQYAEILRWSRQLAEQQRQVPAAGDRPGSATILAALEVLRLQAENDVEVHLLEGRWALLLGSSSQEAGSEPLEKARQAAERARELAPGDSRPPQLALEVALATGRLEDARNQLEELRRLSPGDCEIDRWAARLSLGASRLDSALSQMSAAAEQCPSWDLLLELAQLEEALGQSEAARQTLRRAIERAPRVEQLRRRLAELEGAPPEIGAGAVER